MEQYEQGNIVEVIYRERRGKIGRKNWYWYRVNRWVNN